SLIRRSTVSASTPWAASRDGPCFSTTGSTMWKAPGNRAWKRTYSNRQSRHGPSYWQGSTARTVGIDPVTFPMALRAETNQRANPYNPLRRHFFPRERNGCCDCEPSRAQWSPGSIALVCHRLCGGRLDCCGASCAARVDGQSLRHLSRRVVL